MTPSARSPTFLLKTNTEYPSTPRIAARVEMVDGLRKCGKSWWWRYARAWRIQNGGIARGEGERVRRGRERGRSEGRHLFNMSLKHHRLTQSQLFSPDPDLATQLRSITLAVVCPRYSRLTRSQSFKISNITYLVDERKKVSEFRISDTHQAREIMRNFLELDKAFPLNIVRREVYNVFNWNKMS